MSDYKTVDQAISSRKSVRGYLNKPVDKKTIEEILTVSSRAPSGNNSQPWKVVALTGDALTNFSKALLVEVDRANESGGVSDKSHPYEYDYYPSEWQEPFLSRRRTVGLGLYAKLGITREDKAGRLKQFAENFRFFGAPVGMFILIHRSQSCGGYVDIGMFMENICTAARGRGLDTCPQAVFSSLHKTIYENLDIDKNYQIVCGMSLGYADTEHPANSLITEREPVSEFAQLIGF